MVKPILVLALAGLSVLSAPQVGARPRDREQDAVYKGTQQGRIMPLRSIEAMILPRMTGAEYLGPELDPAAGIYRLKFMRTGRVIWIDVDARSGNILGHSGR